MARKVLIDCDPGIDDAVALCMALFDPRIEVVAVTATAGNVDAHQATRNVQTIVEQLDPPKWPRIGAATTHTDLTAIDAYLLHGPDGLGNASRVGSELHHPRPAEKVIADALRDAPNSVTILALGPLTNLARTLQRDPELTTLIDRMIIMGGSVEAGGNVSAAAEFNTFFDPEAASYIFRSRITKTLVPLDVTQRVPFAFQFTSRLPDELSRAGALMHKVVPFLFRSYRQIMGLESIYLHDAIGLLALLEPELFETEEMAGDVETGGGIARGATIFDRRGRPQWRNNMEVAMNIDRVAAIESVIRGLKYAGQES